MAQFRYSSPGTYADARTTSVKSCVKTVATKWDLAALAHCHEEATLM